uniref:CP12 domain-containing protein n=1 Tax=Ditylum brightwellii TaxID=49249 RepID=A0A6U3RXX4_9STRA
MKTSFAILPFLASMTCAFTVVPTPRFGRHSPTLNLYQSVEEAIADAERICANDPGSAECRVAWDIVEEIESTISHKEGDATNTPLNTTPDLTALLGSFDILVRKIDGKMGQLKATTDKLQELGANDPSVEGLGVRAEEMKNHLAYVRNYLYESTQG